MAKKVWIRCPDCNGMGFNLQVSGNAQCQACGGTGRRLKKEGEKVGRCSRCGDWTSMECICGRLLCLHCIKFAGHCGCEIDEPRKVKQ